MAVGPAPHPSQPAFKLIAIAASAGGLPALAAVLSRLPKEFSVPIAVVQHLHPDHDSVLAHILQSRTALVVKQAAPHDPLTPGRVYVAAPGQHMEVNARGRIRLTRAARVHFVRPSADRLFESAARVYGPIIGVVLSGTGHDGAAGVRAIKMTGGFVIAQDEATSSFFGMPQAAIESGAVDLVLPLERIGPALLDLVGDRP